MDELSGNSLFDEVRGILTAARAKAYSSVNFVMVEAYWTIGKTIVERQGGKEKAEYGDGLIKNLATQLTAEFGKGFNRSNLWYMRQFYLAFPILHSLRGELSWTHYRMLLKVQNEAARQLYLDESIKSQWSTRQLNRQIHSLFYERLLASKDKDSVSQEIQKLEPGPTTQGVLRAHRP